MMRMSLHKIVGYENTGTISRDDLNKRMVVVGGCFDLIHYGHISFLEKAREKGDVLIVLLESDEFIKQRKKREPIHTQQQRAEMLAAFVSVDFIVLLPLLKLDEEYNMIIKKLNPDVVAVTDGDPQLEQKKKQIEAMGGKIEVVTPLIPGLSTSKIIKKYASISRD